MSDSHEQAARELVESHRIYCDNCMDDGNGDAGGPFCAGCTEFAIVNHYDTQAQIAAALRRAASEARAEAFEEAAKIASEYEKHATGCGPGKHFHGCNACGEYRAAGNIAKAIRAAMTGGNR